jgi:glycosyltransferase involved in cell wall biosynthesis
MKIAVNAAYITERERSSGFGRYLENLLTGLSTVEPRHEWVLFAPEALPMERPFPFPVIQLPDQGPRRRFPDRIVKSSPFLTGGFQGLFLPHFEYPSRFPEGVKTVMTVHDLIPTLFLKPDFLLRGRTPWFMLTTQGLLDGLRFRRVLPRLHRAVTVSETSLTDLRRLAGSRARNRLIAIRNAVDGAFTVQSKEELAPILGNYGLPYKSYLFYFGGQAARKNLGIAAQAWAQLDAPLRHRYPLVVLGEGFWTNWIRRRPWGREIRFIPKTSLPNLCALIGGAAFTLYPSVYEGFGFPVLESLRCGTLPLVSDIPSNVELVGSGLEKFHPRRIQSIRALLAKKLGEGPAEPAAVRGLVDLDGYDWSSSAAAFSKIWDEPAQD